MALEQSRVLQAGSQDQDVETTAAWLDEVGLTGPAYLLLHGLRPLSFVGGQGLLFLQPMLPLGTWRAAAERLAGMFEDRSRLDVLLGALEARLSGSKDKRRKEGD